MNNMKCSICGKEIEASTYTDSLPPMCENKKCWKTFYWKRQLKLDARPEYKDIIVIIDGVHYLIGGQLDKDQSIREDITENSIKFNDGRIINTNNLQYLGKIPDEFRNEFPDDNAKFL